MAMIVSDLRIDVELDCKGMFCPMPISQLKKATENMQPGPVLRFIVTDPDSKRDVVLETIKLGGKKLKLMFLRLFYLFAAILLVHRRKSVASRKR